MYEGKSHRATTKQSSYRNTVRPRLIGPIGTKDLIVGYVFKWVSLRVKSVNVLLGSILLGKFVSQIIRKSYLKNE